MQFCKFLLFRLLRTPEKQRVKTKLFEIRCFRTLLQNMGGVGVKRNAISKGLVEVGGQVAGSKELAPQLGQI
jgi:hypothetical protein